MDCSSTNLLLESDQPYFVLEENMANKSDSIHPKEYPKYVVM